MEDIYVKLNAKYLEIIKDVQEETCRRYISGENELSFEKTIDLIEDLLGEYILIKGEYMDYKYKTEHPEEFEDMEEY